jgi:hypothetical protein
MPPPKGGYRDFRLPYPIGGVGVGKITNKMEADKPAKIKFNRWKKWDDHDGAKLQTWTAEMEADKATWINSTDRWRSEHRKEYLAQYGGAAIRYWDCEAQAKKRRDAIAWDAELDMAKTTWINATDRWRSTHRKKYQARYGEDLINFWDSETQTKKRRDQSSHPPFSIQPQAVQEAMERLGVDRLDESAVRKAYRCLAVKAHPDTGGSHQAFVQLQHDRDLILESV